MPNNPGFGLNYDKGFGSGRSYTFQSYDPGANQGILSQMMGNRYARQQAQDQYGYQSGLQHQSNLQRKYEADLAHSANMAGLQNARQIARMQVGAQRHAAGLQQGRWDQFFNLATGPQGLGSVGGGGPVSGPVGTPPEISAELPYTSEGIQQAVNAQRAQNDMRSQAQTRAMQGSLAGRGYGSQSPLSRALSQGFANSAMATSSDFERQYRQNAQLANSQQGLEIGKAREGQYANRQQEQIERDKVSRNYLSSLLGALAGAV